MNQFSVALFLLKANTQQIESSRSPHDGVRRSCQREEGGVRPEEGAGREVGQGRDSGLEQRAELDVPNPVRYERNGSGSLGFLEY